MWDPARPLMALSASFLLANVTNYLSIYLSIVYIYINNIYIHIYIYMARHLVGSREAGDGLIRVLLVGERHERAPCHTTLASAPQPTHVRCSSRVAGLFSNCAPSVNYQKRCARVPYTGDATNAHPATPPTHAPTHRRASHILPLLPFYSRA